MPHRRRAVAPINTIKHYVQSTNASIASGALKSIVFVDAVSATRANTFDVLEGAVIKAIFIEYWLRNNSATGTSAQFNMVIERVPSGLTSITAAQLINLQAYDNKKNILYATQGVAGDIETSSFPIFKSWLLIPKGKQRFGLGDRIVMSFTPTGAACNECGFATYKEYV